MKKLVKFEKNDCNPCAMVSDLLDKKGVEYERINNPELAVKYRVRSVPTVILFEENEEVKRTIGFKPEEINEIISMM